MPKGQPFSIRLDEATERLVETEARRTRRSKSAVVEALTEEAARTRRFPGIAFRGNDVDRRPWVMGTGLDVWQIIQAYDDLGSVEALVSAGDLTEHQVKIALTYRKHYPDEIAAAIADNRRPIDELAGLYPFIGIEPLA